MVRVKESLLVQRIEVAGSDLGIANRARPLREGERLASAIGPRKTV